MRVRIQDRKYAPSDVRRRTVSVLILILTMVLGASAQVTGSGSNQAIGNTRSREPLESSEVTLRDVIRAGRLDDRNRPKWTH